MENKFKYFRQKMEKENLSSLVIDIFQKHYQKLTSGINTYISDKDIKPIENLPHLTTILEEYSEKTDKINKKTVIIKLNGGLGTGMGMECAKSLIKAKNDISFLEIIARQSLKNNQKLILMESFATYNDSKKTLESIMPKEKEIARHFIQNKVPKVQQHDLMPAVFPQNSALEWCPPGHGDIYTSLVISGILDSLIKNDIEYAFISNADNLGAVMEKTIPAYMSENKIPFLMEVAERELEDRKGGHIAVGKNGKIILRELAQCPENDLNHFQNIRKHCYFNTNSIWINLKSLAKKLKRNNNFLELPLIINKKTVDPRDSNSTPVYQLETAMGCAISSFENASAVIVPRDRFRPVKTTSDLALLRSDVYRLNNNDIIERTDKNRKLPFVLLDSKYYKNIDDMEKRFPNGIPSLKKCTSLKVLGDVIISDKVELFGDVSIVNKTEKQVTIPAGVKITGEYIC